MAMTEAFGASEMPEEDYSGRWVDIDPLLYEDMSSIVRQLDPRLRIYDVLELNEDPNTLVDRLMIIYPLLDKAFRNPLLPQTQLDGHAVQPMGCVMQRREEFNTSILVFFGIQGLSPTFYTQHRNHLLAESKLAFKARGLKPFPPYTSGPKPMI
jgi:hypothetical protein